MEGCLTCSDRALPATILELLDDGLALALYANGSREEITLELLDAGPGDRVLVHAGVALCLHHEEVPDA